MALAQKHCVPCQGGVPPLNSQEIAQYKPELHADWQVQREHHLERVFAFADFAEALAFTNRVGELAEQEGHHPDICLGYGEVKIQLYTHKIDGLTTSDFVLAAKIDQL
jgi:4a-hydroxytetrahydrobiopterin dehydratase